MQQKEFCTRLALSLLAFVLVPVAIAGHYEISYSGGTVSIVGPSGPPPWGYPYTTVNGTHGGSGISSDYIKGEGIVLGPGSVNCSGQITTTCTWRADYDGEPTPSVVLVRETSTASWDGESGNAANGLGHVEQNRVSSGVKWTVKSNPGQSFPIYCSPVAFGSTGGPPTGPLTATASVYYGVSVTVPKLVLSGVLDPVVDKKLLIGQRLGMSVIYEGPAPTSQTDTYWWTAGGGSPFSDYQASTASAAKTHWTSHQTTVPIPEQDLFFAKTDGFPEMSVSVTLDEVDLSFELSEDVAVNAPTFQRTSILEPAQAELLPNPTNPIKIGLWGTVFEGTTGGIWFIGRVDTPAVFEAAGNGEWCWTQLFTSTVRWIKDPEGNFYDYQYNFSSGPPRLDSMFPSPMSEPPLANFVAANWARGVTHDDASMGIDNLEDVEGFVEDHLKMYMLYKPPAESRLVPLTSTTWHWKGHAKKEGTTWEFLSRSQSKNDGPDFPNHPEWSAVWLPNGLFNPRNP